jgi:alpha-N-arabinofuranosidase
LNPEAHPIRLHLELDHALHVVDPRLFGSFVEHFGRCVYTGIFEPVHSTADAAGFWNVLRANRINTSKA